MTSHHRGTERRYQRSGWRGPVFDDRSDAAARLVDRLEKRRVRPDVVVALSPDGDVVGETVAEAFGVPLVPLVARVVRPPGDADIALAAVSDGGVVWIDDPLLPGFEVIDEYLERELRRERARARVAADRRRERAVPSLSDRSVLVVTDGIEHRAPVMAAVEQLRRAGAARVTVGTPVIAPDCEERVTEAASEVVSVERPLHFERLEQFYRTDDGDTDAAEPARLTVPTG